MKREFLLLLLLLASPLSAQDDPCRTLLKTWNWTVEYEEEPSTLTLGKDFRGIPNYHYQAASQEVGLDLSPGRNQEVTLRSFNLTERGATTGAKIYAHFALLKGEIIGAWLSTDAPVAPGITSLNNRQFPQRL